MQWEFSSEGVLIALERVDFGNGQIQNVSESNELRPSLKNQFKLRITVTARSKRKLWVEGGPRNQTNAPVAVWAPHHRAIATIIQGDSRRRHIAENQRLVRFVLESKGDVEDFIVRAIGTG